MSANDLVLTVLNEGRYYQRLCANAKLRPPIAAPTFANLVADAAARYTRQFGDEFTSAEILQAAAEVAAYHARHLAERVTLARAEGVAR